MIDNDPSPTHVTQLSGAGVRRCIMNLNVTVLGYIIYKSQINHDNSRYNVCLRQFVPRGNMKLATVTEIGKSFEPANYVASPFNGKVSTNLLVDTSSHFFLC